MATLTERFYAALADDFRTPEALAALLDSVREANRRIDDGRAVGVGDLERMLGVLGLSNLLDAPAEAPSEAIELARRREQARSVRDFAESDRLRDAIAALGWEVRDVADGFELLPRT